MTDPSGPIALLSVIGMLIVGGIMFFWANDTFAQKAPAMVNVPAPAIGRTEPAPSGPAAP